MRSINAQNRPVEQGEAGQRCALVLSGPHISKEAVRRGDVVLDPALHAPTARIDASLRVLPSEPRPDRPVVSGQGAPCRRRGAGPRRRAARRRRSIRARRTTCSWCSSGPWLRPSATASSFATPRRAAPSAAACFIDLRAPERRRRTPERRAEIEALAQQRSRRRRWPRALAGPSGWIDLDAFCRDRAIGADAAAA